MGKFVDITGQRYGRLTVIKIASKGKHTKWLCKCDCGKECIIFGCALKSGNTKSCGCLNSELVIERQKKHGMNKSRLYKIYCQIKYRCYNVTYSEFQYYGGRGIKMCDEWRNDFMAFYSWAMANGYADNLTIDRIDANGNYEPSNCRWATQKKQQNNRRNNRVLTHNDETHTIAEWSEKTGINYKTLYSRIYTLKWDIAKALGF